MAYFVMGIVATLTVQWLWRKGYGDGVLLAGIVFCVFMLIFTGSRLGSQ